MQLTFMIERIDADCNVRGEVDVFIQKSEVESNDGFRQQTLSGFRLFV